MIAKLRPHHIEVLLSNKFDNFNALSQDLRMEGHPADVVGKMIGLFRQLIADTTNQIKITAIDTPGDDTVCAMCEQKKVCDTLSSADGAGRSTDRDAVRKYRLRVGEAYSMQELINRHALTIYAGWF